MNPRAPLGLINGPLNQYPYVHWLSNRPVSLFIAGPLMLIYKTLNDISGVVLAGNLQI